MDEKDVKRKEYIGKTETDVEERTVTATINTATVDRQKEVVLPNGADLERYQKNPIVLWAHQYSETPIARCLWIKKSRKSIVAKAKFAQTEKADEIFQLYRDGYLSAFSIGFIAKKWREPSPEDIKKHPEWAEAKRVIEQWELLEFSAVPVPANPEALVVAVKSNDIKISPETKAELGLEDEQDDDEEATFIVWDSPGFDVHKRGVIPYRQTPKAPENTPWDGGKEVAAADVDDLKIMCAWYDASKPDLKSSYKLPHHQAKGAHPVVWRAVANAMARLNQTDIPAADKPGVYRHLARHYKEFGKEPPKFMDSASLELKPYPNEHSCRLHPPENYDKFRRVNCAQKHDGKCIDVVYGIKDGKSEIQALRFSTKVWTAAAAKAVCKARGGTFEPAAASVQIQPVSIRFTPVVDVAAIAKEEIKRRKGLVY